MHISITAHQVKTTVKFFFGHNLEKVKTSYLECDSMSQDSIFLYTCPTYNPISHGDILLRGDIH